MNICQLKKIEENIMDENKMKGFQEYLDKNHVTVDQKMIFIGGLFRGEILSEYSEIEYLLSDTISAYYYEEKYKEKHKKLFLILDKNIVKIDSKIQLYIDTLIDDFPNIKEITNKLSENVLGVCIKDYRNTLAHNIIAKGEKPSKVFLDSGKVSFIRLHRDVYSGIAINLEMVNIIKEKLVSIKGELIEVSNIVRSNVGLQPLLL